MSKRQNDNNKIDEIEQGDELQQEDWHKLMLIMVQKDMVTRMMIRSTKMKILSASWWEDKDADNDVDVAMMEPFIHLEVYVMLVAETLLLLTPPAL